MGQKKLKKIRIPLKINFEQFVKNTSIATSTMMIRKKIAKVLNSQTRIFVKIIFISVRY